MIPNFNSAAGGGSSSDAYTGLLPISRGATRPANTQPYPQGDAPQRLARASQVDSVKTLEQLPADVRALPPNRDARQASAQEQTRYTPSNRNDLSVQSSNTYSLQSLREAAFASNLSEQVGVITLGAEVAGADVVAAGTSVAAQLTVENTGEVIDNAESLAVMAFKQIENNGESRQSQFQLVDVYA